MQKRFTTLFYLTGSSCSLIEIKRLDLGDGQEVGKIFHWLRLDHETETLQKLDFRSMNSQPPNEAREFAQGALRFDRSSGVFTEAASGQSHALQVQAAEQAPASLLALVDGYLDGCP